MLWKHISPIVSKAFHFWACKAKGYDETLDMARINFIKKKNDNITSWTGRNYPNRKKLLVRIVALTDNYNSLDNPRRRPELYVRLLLRELHFRPCTPAKVRARDLRIMITLWSVRATIRTGSFFPFRKILPVRDVMLLIFLIQRGSWNHINRNWNLNTDFGILIFFFRLINTIIYKFLTT